MSDAPGTATGGSPFLDRAYSLGRTDQAGEARALYDEWAETFDAEITGPDQGYVGHRRVAETVARVKARPERPSPLSVQGSQPTLP